MKKLISILILFLFFSCGNFKEEMVVTNVQEYRKGKFSVSLGWYEFDTDSIYRVGDTLKIGKK